MPTRAPAEVNRNPFPGLRPFRTDEEHLYFGRESQVDRMIDKLAGQLGQFVHVAHVCFSRSGLSEATTTVRWIMIAVVLSGVYLVHVAVLGLTTAAFYMFLAGAPLVLRS